MRGIDLWGQRWYNIYVITNTTIPFIDSPDFLSLTINNYFIIERSNMNMIRVLSAVIAVAIIISFVSCGSTKDIPAQTTMQSNESESETTVEEIDYDSMSVLERLQYDYNSVPDGLPDQDFGGDEIVISVMSNNVIGPEEQTGEIIDDALYKRRLNIEERFNCKLKKYAMSWSDHQDYTNQMNAIFLSNDDIFDLVEIWNTKAVVFCQQGFFTDLTQVDTINFDKPWFFNDAISRFSYKNHKFVSVDMLSATNPISGLNCVFFNKDMAEQYGVENLYDVVKDNKWTFDYAAALVKGIYSDLDGDGIVNSKQDEFGYEIATATYSFTAMPSFDLQLIGKDENDVPFFPPSVNIERFDKIYSSVRSLIKENDSVTSSDWGDGVFSSGRALLFSDIIGTMNGMRDVEFNIGILPLYRYDETQENYKACFLPNPSGIPVSHEDKERSGILLSALAAGGYKEVLVPYFETVVKTKYTTDEDSAEMLDIIVSNVTTDGTIMYNGSMIYFFLEFLKTSKEFASYWASQEKSGTKYMDKVIASYEEIIG